MTVDIDQIAAQAVQAGGNVYILTIESGSSPTIVFGNNWGVTSGAKKTGKKEGKAAPAPPPPNPPAPPVPPTPEEAPPPPPPPGGSLWGAPRQRR